MSWNWIKKAELRINEVTLIATEFATYGLNL